MILKPAFERGGSSEVNQGGIVAKSAPPLKSGVCFYCGLQSGVASHGSVSECIDALEREVARLRDFLRHGKPSVPVAVQRATHSENARATSAPLTHH